ncbi:hypothetical protein CCP3SC15_60024 [Gammaproteobacteria bacterium]
MSYGSFTIETLKKKFDITITEVSDFFTHIDAVMMGDFLADTSQRECTFSLGN